LDTELVDSAELVITGPGPSGPALAHIARCRTTIGVYTQLLVEAEQEVVIAAPYLQQGHGLSAGPIEQALIAALKRGVRVDVTSTAQGLASLNYDALRQYSPEGRLRFFRPIANVRDAERLGSHAKFCVVDGQQAYIGSANLTGPGLSEHIEMGLLVRGRIARQVRELWDFCRRLGVFVQVPRP
jgi:phosphatidylserine/phosphatidylglycerophosphate/cardiolipin synthase-like enzyme